MRVFEGHDAHVYAVGEPFTFEHLPLRDLGDGFAWGCHDETLRCWLEDADFVFEALEDGRWDPVAPLAVRHAAGEVSFGRCLRGLEVRCSGVALTTALVAQGSSWRLTQATVSERTLSGPAFALGTAVAAIAGIDGLPASLAAVRRVLAVLPTAAGAFVGLGEPSKNDAGLRVIFDPKGVTYANG